MENVEIYASASGSGRHMAHMAHMTSAVWPSHCRGQLQLGREGGDIMHSVAPVRRTK